MLTKRFLLDRIEAQKIDIEYLKTQILSLKYPPKYNIGEKVIFQNKEFIVIRHLGVERVGSELINEYELFSENGILRVFELSLNN